jgi:nickel-dependent lactate racemase
LIDRDKAGRILEDGLSRANLDGKRVLVITPDNTRSGPMPLMFSLFCEILLTRVRRLDYLIALGTHQPLGEEAINRLYGITPDDRKGRYSNIKIQNHDWHLTDTFRQIGIIPASEIEEISGGLMKQDVPVELNRLILDYDHVIICGPVFPHEVAGFSGGHKYLFPGIAGPDIINFTHWLGALITNYEIIGRADTPVRSVIERAADMIDVPMTGVCEVVEGEEGLWGLFVGTVQEAWRDATELSASKHIRYVDRPYRLVVSVMPEMYEDLWVGAKGMYKMEPVVADGGEVIIYAPHIREVSFTHGELIKQVGYHVRDYFTRQWDKFKQYPGAVLAHSTHVKGMGTFIDGREEPRINVTLATGIPEEVCKKINLGYKDPDKFDPQGFDGRRHEGILVAWHAGEILYRINI